MAAPSLRVRPCTAADKAAAAEQAQQEEAAAAAAAALVGELVFEGQPAGAPGANTMGVFGPMQPAKMVNRRAVWQAADGKDRYAYFADDGKWYINDGESMRAGKARGWVCSAAAEPDALTPDQVKGGWQATDADL